MQEFKSNHQNDTPSPPLTHGCRLGPANSECCCIKRLDSLEEGPKLHCQAPIHSGEVADGRGGKCVPPGNSIVEHILKCVSVKEIFLSAYLANGMRPQTSVPLRTLPLVSLSST